MLPEGFFASQTAMATALGVQRDTIRVWERGRATRLRRTLVQRVTVMSAVAEQVARYMPTERSVGDWLLSPQPGLEGESPAALVRRRGVAAYEPILRVARVAEPADVPGLDARGRRNVELAALLVPLDGAKRAGAVRLVSTFFRLEATHSPGRLGYILPVSSSTISRSCPTGRGLSTPSSRAAWAQRVGS